MTFFKTLLFLLFVPVLLLGVLPIRLITTSTAWFSFGVLRWLALPLWLVGAVMMTWCARDFTIKGRGTPAPLDPPKELVICGLYHYLRNPMYVAGILVLLGYVFWHPTPAILICPSAFFLAAHLFVTRYEEPHLRKIFGEKYAQYCKYVPRWIPHL